MKTYDPKLRECMKEIEELLKKYDVGGFVSLHSRTHGEFKFFIDTPSWSNVRWIKEGQAMHLKIYAKSEHARTEDTIAMLYQIRDQAALVFKNMDQLANLIEQQVKVKHIPFGGGITNEDRE